MTHVCEKGPMAISVLGINITIPYFLGSGILLFGIFLTGCTTVVHPPNLSIKNDTSSIIAKNTWAEVLKRFVDVEGRVDFNSLRNNPLPLYQYVNFIAQTSPVTHPDKFPTHEERLAYFLNSYNALAMYGVISQGIPKDFSRFTSRAGFFKFTTFNIGGEYMSLYDYEYKIIRPLGDPRVHFALNCMVKACPRLPQTPFNPENIHQVLNTLTKEFVNHPRHVQVIESARLIRISEIFKFYSNDFVNEQVSPSLIAYINRYRNDDIPENYNLEFIEYDWTINNK